MFQQFKFIVLLLSQMDSQRRAPGKYNKVNQQKKYHLLSLVYRRAIPLRDAAEIVGINFLTAKTILFFHKNQCKSYRFDLSSEKIVTKDTNYFPLTAAVESVRRQNSLNDTSLSPLGGVQVVCSTGGVLNQSGLLPAAFIKNNEAEEEDSTVLKGSKLAGYRSLVCAEATQEPERE